MVANPGCESKGKELSVGSLVLYYFDDIVQFVGLRWIIAKSDFHMPNIRGKERH